MGLKGRAAANTGDFESPPEGTHRAVCTRVLDMGTQDTNFGPKRRLQLGFEIDVLRDDGKPYMAFAHHTLSFHPKSNLMAQLASWRGRRYDDDDDVDVAAVLGKPCLLTLQKNGDFTNITAVSPMMKGMGALTPAGKLLSFDADEPDLGVLELLSERMREKIEASPEYKAAMTADDDAHAGDRDSEPHRHDERDFDDGIPF